MSILNYKNLCHSFDSLEHSHHLLWRSIQLHRTQKKGKEFCICFESQWCIGNKEIDINDQCDLLENLLPHEGFYLEKTFTTINSNEYFTNHIGTRFEQTHMFYHSREEEITNPFPEQEFEEPVIDEPYQIVTEGSNKSGRALIDRRGYKLTVKAESEVG